MKRISIDPITRLEGHGRVDIFLDDEGHVANTYLRIPELRGFEQFCVGRPVEELPRITTRICGVCPEAHHLASAKACDAPAIRQRQTSTVSAIAPISCAASKAPQKPMKGPKEKAT